MEQSAYNFLRGLLERAIWSDSAIEIGGYKNGKKLKEEARRIIDWGSGLCLDCMSCHEDGKCPEAT